jgi:hypothetical protein
VGLGYDETFSLQASEGLANRGGAHSEHVGDVTLAKMTPWLEVSRFDHPSQSVGDEI